MPSLIRPLDIADISVSIDSLSWIPQSRFSTEQISYAETLFIEAKRFKLFNHGKTFHKKRKAVDFTDCSWLFSQAGDTIPTLGFAYYQKFAKGRSTKGYLYISISSVDLIHVYLLISLIFRVTTVDEVTMKLHLGRDFENELDESFSKKTLITSSQNRNGKHLCGVSVAVVSKYEWFNSSAEQLVAHRLKHISARQERLEKADSPQRKIRRSLLTRLFYPRIDDSLL